MKRKKNAPHALCGVSLPRAALPNYTWKCRTVACLHFQMRTGEAELLEHPGSPIENAELMFLTNCTFLCFCSDKSRSSSPAILKTK